MRGFVSFEPFFEKAELVVRIGPGWNRNAPQQIDHVPADEPPRIHVAIPMELQPLKAALRAGRPWIRGAPVGAF
mgnify:CR=1 FL=1